MMGIISITLFYVSNLSTWCLTVLAEGAAETDQPKTWCKTNATLNESGHIKRYVRVFMLSVCLGGVVPLSQKSPCN